jgi:hypothetical protein
LSRDKWKDLIEIIGVIAIVLSLVFVGFEIRQNTNAVRSSVLHASAQGSFDTIAMLLENEALRDAQSAIDGPPNDENRRMMYLYYSALLRVQLNRYMQSQLGVLDVDSILLVGGQGGIYDRPSFREFWAPRRAEFEPGFVEFMENRVFTGDR